MGEKEARMTSRRIFLTLAVAAAFTACGSEDPELDFIGCPIINGTPDTSPEHMAVVGVFSGFGQCTGTLIHHRVVLTAAHCVDGNTAAEITVAFGNNINWGGGASRVTVTEKWQHPSYNGSARDITYDIALLRLTDLPPVTVTYIPHLPYSLRITSSDIGTLAEYVGFGQTDGSGSGQVGFKMTMTNQIEWVCYSGSCSGWSNPGQMNTFCQDQSPSGVCFGDSGGPAFVTRSGTEYTAGIASYVGGNCRSFGCHTKVDEYVSHILAFITMANGAACVHDSECDSGICANGACCSTRCSGECMGCDIAGSLGQCVPAPDGYWCPDFDKCDGNETCQNGVCTDSPDLSCDDNNACTADSCNPSVGCVHTPVGTGTSCSDGDICNGVETCQSGACVSSGGLNCADGDICTCMPGTGPICDDGNSCTADQCVPGTGCVHDTYQAGTPCDDGNICTTGEACIGGVCTGQVVGCDDHNLCTEDSCDPVAGCLHASLPDGTGCGGGMCGQAVCSQGLCQPVDGISCEDYDPCTNDWCDPQQGCMHEPLPDGYDCGECYMCLGGRCMKATNCGGDGGCGCGGLCRAGSSRCGHTGHELPAWFGLLLMTVLFFRRRR